MKAVWIGGVFSSEALARHRAVNQAQNRWSLGLIEALCERGWSFQSLAFRAEQLWPKGHVRPGLESDFHPAVEPLLVKTWNLPFIRDWHLPFAYKQRLKKHLECSERPDVVITYNPLPWHVPAAELAAQSYGIPWLSITLDLKHPGEQMEHFARLNHKAAGQVILSWWGYENCPLEPKLHLDGGYDTLQCDEANYSPSAKKIILYSGKYTDYGGDDLLADTIEACKRDDIEFWLLGKGQNARIERLGQDDLRVKRYGFVNDAKLDELCRKAHVFLNPRPNAFADNLMTYPSKLLFYMACGKPIVSTWTPGLSPEYRPFLQVPLEETGQSFAQTIDAALAMGASNRQALRDVMFQFLHASRSWKAQAKKLEKFTTTLTKK